MQFNSFAYVFLMPGFDADTHVSEMSKNGFRYKTVGIDMANKSEVLAVAKQLVAEGYQMIELCGGFGPEWITKVRDELDGKVPVGGVFYGPEFRKPLVDLLAKD